MGLASMRVADEPSIRSRDWSRLKSKPPLISDLIFVYPFCMAYEDWNEIEDDDQDELQDASVG